MDGISNKKRLIEHIIVVNIRDIEKTINKGENEQNNNLNKE